MIEQGCKVRCVDGTRPAGKNGEVIPNFVEEGEVYIVREILNNDDIVVGVLLQEIVNHSVYIPLLDRFQEPAFATWRFRVEESAHKVEESVKEESYED